MFLQVEYFSTSVAVHHEHFILLKSGTFEGVNFNKFQLEFQRVYATLT
jgi:hypothetical protein